MSGAYKWLGGLGYIFAIIPFLNFISPILVGLAWWLMGRDTRNSVFTVTGVLMIVVLVLSISIILIFPAQLFMMFPFMGTDIGMTTAAIQQLLQMVGLLIIVGLAIIALGLAVFILELVSHFRASAIFSNKWFRYAAWIRIIAIILLVLMFGFIIVASMSAGISASLDGTTINGFDEGPMPDAGVMLLILGPFALVGLLVLLAAIFSAIAFFTLPEYPQPQAYPQNQQS